MKVIIDMASVIQTGLRKGSDDESYVVEHEGKEVRINTAGHAYENVVDYLTSVLDTYNLTPSDMIMVFEGKDQLLKQIREQNEKAEALAAQQPNLPQNAGIAGRKS